MSSTQLRKASAHEAELLQSISRQTFFETFAEHNSAEDMRAYLEKSFSLEKLSAELHDPHSAFYFATDNNKIIGYLKLNFGESQTEIKDESAIEIERIYVLKEYHGKGAGNELYQKALQVALELKIRYIWLGVWEKNERAIQFYKKNGFVVFDKHIFRLGNDEQTDYLMKVDLSQ